MSRAELVDKNLCRLCGERRAVREGRHPLLKENFAPKILQFTGVCVCVCFVTFCSFLTCQLLIFNHGAINIIKFTMDYYT